MKWFCLKLFVDDISGRSLNFLNDIRGLFFELIFLLRDSLCDKSHWNCDIILNGN